MQQPRLTGQGMTQFTAKIKSMVAENRKFRFSAPEILIFAACLGRVQALLTLVQSFETGEMDRGFFVVRVNAVLRQLCRTAEATQRFDIVAPVLEFGHFSTPFWRWFNWWNEYRKTLRPEQIDEIERLVQQELPELDDYRPKGDWFDHSDGTPAFLLEVTSS